MASHVDPIMHDMITFLLLEQPKDVKEGMLSYLRSNRGPTTTKRRVSRKDRMYMISEISPVLTEMLADVVRARPRAPKDFMIAWLGNKSFAKAKALDNAVKIRNILVIGDSSAGKTTLIKRLCGLEDTCRPTRGFKRYELGSDDGGVVRLMDISGKGRRGWRSYFHMAHAAIFVVDSSSSENLRESFDYVFRCSRDDEDARRDMLRGKPLLVVANKQDRENRILPEVMATNVLDLSSLQSGDSQPVAVCPCVCVGDSVDGRLVKAIDWIVETIDSDLEKLEERVSKESEVIDMINLEQAQEKERRVFRKVLQKAFADPPEECLEEAEGIEFFKAELGLSPDVALPDIAARLAEKCNYQKLALQLMGSFKCPINKKRTALDWPSISDYVTARIVEIS